MFIVVMGWDIAALPKIGKISAALAICEHGDALRWCPVSRDRPFRPSEKHHGYSDLDPAVHERRPWNAGKNVGPKRPLKPRDIWAIQFYLDEHRRLRDRALFGLAIDSKLRGCDLVKIRIGDVISSGSIRNRSTVIEQKTGRPVQFEIMSEARKSLTAWLERRRGTIYDFAFPSRIDYLGI